MVLQGKRCWTEYSPINKNATLHCNEGSMLKTKDPSVWETHLKISNILISRIVEKRVNMYRTPTVLVRNTSTKFMEEQFHQPNSPIRHRFITGKAKILEFEIEKLVPLKRALNDVASCLKVSIK
jgi:hypothetical protein